HDGVADIFVDDAAMSTDRPGHHREIVVHHLHEAARGHALAHRGEAAHVAEHDGHHAPLAVEGDLRPIDQPLHHLGIDVAAKCLADTLVLAQLLDHPVEGRCELSDLVLRRYADRP